MTPIEAWLRRQAIREQRVVTLEDALLGGRAWAYAGYRLRYFSLRCVSSAVLHGVRLTFLHYIFSHQAFLTTLLLNAIAGLVTSFWWGALEVLRARVRHLSRDAERHRIPATIGAWLNVTMVLAAGCVLLPLGWVGWSHAVRLRAFDVLQLYTIAIGLRAAADLMTLTFHSGVYALRRVYRPLPAMVAVELASLLAVPALWPWIGRWSFPVAVLLGTAVSTGLAVYYTARVYRLLGWLPVPLGRPSVAPFARASTVVEMVTAGLSYALMKLDAFLMLAMFHTRAPTHGGVSLFVFFVSIGPAIQAGFDWAQLLYFDLKKLNTRCLRALCERYQRTAFHVAWAVGLLLWGFACVLGTAITRRNLGELYWLIGPFFVARSFLGLAQVEAFAARRYRALFASGVLLLAFMGVLQARTLPERWRVLGLAAVSAVAASVLRTGAGDVPGERDERRVLPVTDWVARLQAVRGPVRVRSLRFRSQARQVGSRPANALGDRWRLRRMARRIGRGVRGGGAATVLLPGQIAWYETASGYPAVSPNTLLRWGGGLITSIAGTPLEADGVEALRTGLANEVLGGPLVHQRRCAPRRVAISDVRKVFAAMVPQGVAYAPEEPVPALLRSVSSRERGAILFQAVHFATHLRGSVRRGRFDVTSLLSDGELRLIFVIDRRIDHQQRLRWRAWIRATNVASVLAPARRATSQGRRVRSFSAPKVLIRSR